MIGTVDETSEVRAAADAVRAKEDEIREEQARLEELQETRRRAAVEGRETLSVREHISAAEVRLEDLHAQLDAAVVAFTAAQGTSLERARMAAALAVYGYDREYLRRLRVAVVARQRLAEAEAACGALSEGTPWPDRRLRFGELRELGVRPGELRPEWLARFPAPASMSKGWTTEELDEGIGCMTGLIDQASALLTTIENEVTNV